MKIIFNLLFISCVIGLSACSSPNQPAQANVSSEADEGRAETKSIEAADAVGYDGTAIRSKLDTALDANDQHAADLSKEIDAQTDGAERPDE